MIKNLCVMQCKPKVQTALKSLTGTQSVHYIVSERPIVIKPKKKEIRNHSSVFGLDKKDKCVYSQSWKIISFHHFFPAVAYIGFTHLSISPPSLYLLTSICPPCSWRPVTEYLHLYDKDLLHNITDSEPDCAHTPAAVLSCHQPVQTHG